MPGRTTRIPRNTVIGNDRIVFVPGETPLEIASLKNPINGFEFALPANQSVLVRTPGELSEPIFLTAAQTAARRGNSIQYTLKDPSRKYSAVLDIEPNGRGLRFTLDVSSPVPLWMAEWQLSGLNLEEILIPALGGQSLTTAMPPGRSLAYKYPFWWNAQFVIGRTQQGGIALHILDDQPVMKLLRVQRLEAGFALTLGFEAEGPLKAKTLHAEWSLESFHGSWTEQVDRHAAWMEGAYGVRWRDERPEIPAWTGDVNIILELWGMRRDTPEPHHTFAQMIDRIHEWKKLHDPAHTLLYLPGFAGHGIDSHAPNYNPSPYLGGPKKFAELVNTAHDLGYRVMIHTNVLAMTFTHPCFAKFKKYQVVDVFGRAQSWGLDMDGDWLPEPYFAYINPGAKAWGDLMEETLGGLIRRYKLDGVFLDQTLLAFNVSKGPNFIEGMRAHVERLRKAFPATVFAGEGINEYIVRALPMAQIHGLDSLREVHGMEDPQTWRRAHPVSSYLFGRYTRLMAHLLTRHPSDPTFAHQEDAYARLGVLPAVCFYTSTQPMDIPQVHAMIGRANAMIQENHS